MYTLTARLSHSLLVAISLAILASKAGAMPGRSSGIGNFSPTASVSSGTTSTFNWINNTGKTITRKVYGTGVIYTVTYDVNTGKVLNYTTKLGK